MNPKDIQFLSQRVLEEAEWLRHRSIVAMQINDFPYSQIMWRRLGKTLGPEFQALANGLTSG